MISGTCKISLSKGALSLARSYIVGNSIDQHNLSGKQFGIIYQDCEICFQTVLVMPLFDFIKKNKMQNVDEELLPMC